MAEQVRPWSEQPEVTEAPRVRVSDRGVDQRSPSGTAIVSRSESPHVREQPFPYLIITNRLFGKLETSMYGN